jgi:asparagine synthase (glutamine-hydrolysing)
LGPEALIRKLEGMFALGFWDRIDARLVLAKDRLGIKPLSIYRDSRVLIFTSETGALAPWIELEPDALTVSAFLGGVPPPTQGRSFFKHVSLLAPGTVLESRIGSTPREVQVSHLGDLWDPKRRADLSRLSEQEMVDTVEEHLLRSVGRHIKEETVGGALVSGGVDSSLMLAMAAKFNPNMILFHSNVKGPCSEYEAAKQVAKHIHVELQAADFDEEDSIEYLPTTIRYYEYPFSYHPNSVAFFLACRLIREKGVKAVLSGHGGDACFIGYASMAVEGLVRKYERFLAGLRGLVHKVPKIGTTIWPPASDDYRFLEGLLTRFDESLERQRVFDRVTKESGNGLDPREYRTLELVGYDSRSVMHRDERLSMACGVETRFPFLDDEFLRLAANIPLRHKIRTSLRAVNMPRPFIREKWVLRQVASRYLPKGFAFRGKVGFPATVFKRMTVHPEFFRESYICDLFGLSRAEKAHLFATTERRTIVRMMFLEVWAQLFFCGRPESELVQKVRPHISVAPA